MVHAYTSPTSLYYCIQYGPMVYLPWKKRKWVSHISTNPTFEKYIRRKDSISKMQNYEGRKCRMRERRFHLNGTLSALLPMLRLYLRHWCFVSKKWTTPMRVAWTFWSLLKIRLTRIPLSFMLEKLLTLDHLTHGRHGTLRSTALFTTQASSFAAFDQYCVV